MKKVKKHEPQTSKEDQEKLARRFRAQKRRERKAAEDAAQKERVRKSPKLRKAVDDGDKPPAVVSKRVPESEEESFLSLAELNGMINPPLSFIKFCEPHYSTLVDYLKKKNLVPWMAIDHPDLQDKLKKKEIEPLFHSFDGLIRLALKALGPASLKEHHCPVCAFEKHDYLDQVSDAIKEAIFERIKE